MPDDDIVLSAKDINSLFDICSKRKLQLAQPAVQGYVSHPLHRQRRHFIIRYVNFVEVLAPCMSIAAFSRLVDSFDLTQSSWGIDYIWPHLLGYPKNSIAVIDSIVMIHTRPVGTDYSRFEMPPPNELRAILKEYRVSADIKTYSALVTDYIRVPRLLFLLGELRW